MTIHHALIVCKAVHRVCPWDDEMDAKENEWSDVSDQSRNVTILVLRRQKPLTIALDGLYFPCVYCMLEARWVEGCGQGVHVSDGKVARGFPLPTMV